MMKEHRYSNEIKSIRLQTSSYDSVSQTATSSRMLLMTFHINFFNKLT